MRKVNSHYIRVWDNRFLHLAISKNKLRSISPSEECNRLDCILWFNYAFNSYLMSTITEQETFSWSNPVKAKTTIENFVERLGYHGEAERCYLDTEPMI